MDLVIRTTNLEKLPLGVLQELRKKIRESTIPIIYVLADSWYSSIKNIICCKEESKRDFIMALKSNRKVALSKENKENKQYINIETRQ